MLTHLFNRSAKGCNDLVICREEFLECPSVQNASGRITTKAIEETLYFSQSNANNEIIDSITASIAFILQLVYGSVLRTNHQLASFSVSSLIWGAHVGG
jgi:hypothetical protein